MTRPTPEKPKPCPWCGERGVVWSGEHDWDSHWYCGCRNERCIVMPKVGHDASKSAAVADWNRRAK